jgi:hypothetical protein
MYLKTQGKCSISDCDYAHSEKELQMIEAAISRDKDMKPIFSNAFGEENVPVHELDTFNQIETRTPQAIGRKTDNIKVWET